jgi:large subunit ribosomal protein L31
MKAKIHPQYFENATVVCVCGNRFTLGSTSEHIQVELCYKCHPFYTGEERFIDTGSVIQRFQDKRAHAKTYQATQKQKVEEKKRKDEAPKSLRDMLLGTK